MFDRRFLLAIVLTSLVVLVIPRLFPVPPPTRPPAARGADSLAARRIAAESAAARDSGAAAAAAAAATAGADTLAAAAAGPGAPIAGDTVTVATPLVTYRFSTLGATPVEASLTRYESYTRRGERVQLSRPGTPVLRFRLATGDSTMALDRMPFAVDSAAGGAGRGPITFRAPVGPAAEAVIQYTLAPDNYLVRVSGQVTGMPGAQLLVTIPNGLRSEEADTLEDIRTLSYALKPTRGEARGIPFSKLDTLRAQTETDGPYTWVASKNKYFLVALLTPEGGQPFTGVRIEPAPRARRALATSAAATVTQPLSAEGRFAFELYAGPQEWRRLRALGRDFEHVNPYGWDWLRGIIQPFATAMMQLLLWMHDQLRLSYGWVLVIFGILVRIILWPLNQYAMKNSLKMQALQPQLQELQKKHRNEPQKQQQAMMQLYRENEMSPFTPLLGCLPMMIPMPFLFALFFVFQNTIEFRGVSFFWLHDISQKDPYYILPVLMAISMYVLSWIGLRGAPPNPQATMLMYMLPAVMLFALRNMAAGLNLYYAVQNVAALPQQWLIARERARKYPPKAPPKRE